MQHPIIVVADDDRGALEALEQDLRRQYASQYQIIKAESGEAALAALQELRQRNEPVALVLADQRMRGMGGVELLVEARRLYPDARRVLLGDYAAAEVAIVSVNATGIDRYLIKPCDLPDAHLYPVVDELLDDWLISAQLPYMQIKSIMSTQVALIRHGATLHHAAAIVARTGIGDLMVVDDEGKFVGVLSEGDILRNALPDFDEILEAGGTLYEAYQLFMRNGRQLSNKPIMPLVIRNPIVMHPDDHVAKAATVLIERQIRRLPVVQDRRLVGTVSRANICQAVVGTL
jgi:CBS domain-containing protein/ActR/RegA family two-component response regulator